jgi:mRNA interferase MazF
VQRGQIYWANLPAPAGRRPVLLVTRTPGIAVRNAVTVAPVTHTIRGIRSEVELDRRHGLGARSVASCDSLQTIPKNVLGRRPIGGLTTDELPSLDRALAFALGIRSIGSGS